MSEEDLLLLDEEEGEEKLVLKAYGKWIAQALESARFSNPSAVQIHLDFCAFELRKEWPVIFALNVVAASMNAAGLNLATTAISDRMWDDEWWDLPEDWGLGSWDHYRATGYPKYWVPLEYRDARQWEVSFGAGLLNKPIRW